MALITKNNLNRFYSEKLYLVENPKKSNLQVGDFVITNEHKSNIYFVASKDTVKQWLRLDEDIDMIFVQSLSDYGISEAYLPFTGYDADLKWIKSGRLNYSINYVFRTLCTAKDLESQKGVENATLKIYYQIKTNFPEIAKSIHV